MPTDDVETRGSLLREVKTPLSFFALVVLIAEGLLGYLATKAEGTDITIMVAGMLLLLLVPVGAVAFHSSRSGRRNDEARFADDVPIKHDVFLASPMAAFPDDENYRKNREDVMKLVDAFRTACQFKSVVFAGKEIESIKGFEAPDISAADDIQALRESRLFVLYYTEKIVSSVLFEAGVALALHKPSLYFVRDRDHLPFLMRQAEQAFDGVRIYECRSADEIIALIEKHREKLFSFPKHTDS